MKTQRPGSSSKWWYMLSLFQLNCWNSHCLWQKRQTLKPSGPAASFSHPTRLFGPSQRGTETQYQPVLIQFLANVQSQENERDKLGLGLATHPEIRDCWAHRDPEETDGAGLQLDSVFTASMLDVELKAWRCRSHYTPRIHAYLVINNSCSVICVAWGSL